MKARQKVIAIFSVLAICACAIVGLCLWQLWAGDSANSTDADATVNRDIYVYTQDEKREETVELISQGLLEQPYEFGIEENEKCLSYYWDYLTREEFEILYENVSEETKEHIDAYIIEKGYPSWRE